MSDKPIPNEPLGSLLARTLDDLADEQEWVVHAAVVYVLRDPSNPSRHIYGLRSLGNGYAPAHETIGLLEYSAHALREDHYVDPLDAKGDED